MTREIERQLGGTPEEVVELLDSPDGDVRSMALKELIARKEHGIPAMVAALEGGSKQVRGLAAEGLAHLADPSTADNLAGAVKDKDETVRAYAASGLANMEDPRAVDALVDTLGDSEDFLHTPYTLSTYALARVGPSALPKVLPLLSARDKATRTRARYVVQRILEESGMISDSSGIGELMDEYDPGAKASERNKAARAISKWLKEHPVRAGGSDAAQNNSMPDLSKF